MVNLTVASHKGGSGKTTTAVTLAACAYERGIPTYLIDLDANRSASHHVTSDVISGPGSGEMLAMDSSEDFFSVARPVREKAPAGADQPVSRLYLIPGSPRLTSVNHELKGDPQLLRYLLDEAYVEANGLSDGDPIPKNQYEDHINVIDCGQGIDMLTLNGIAASDIMICPVNCTGISLSGIDQLLRNIEKARRNGWTGSLYFLPTIYSEASGKKASGDSVISSLVSRYGRAEENEDGQVLPPIRTWVGYDKAFRSGKTPIEIQSGRSENKAATDYRRVFELILKREFPGVSPETPTRLDDLPLNGGQPVQPQTN
jgi:chromosome partitioning protein